MSSPIEPISGEVVSFLAPYLKGGTNHNHNPNPPSIIRRRPFITLTYATSLDSHVSLAPGIQTPLSGSQSKSLTHYLRKTHDGILVGVGTAVVDDPGLNCRLDEDLERKAVEGRHHQPRPIVVDPAFRWSVTWDSRVLRTMRERKGLAPWVLVDEEEGGEGFQERIELLEEHGGKVIRVPKSARIPSDSERKWVWDWRVLFEILYKEGVSSLMIEGGARVINELLSKEGYLGMIDSVIVTIAPVYFGRNGVNVSPQEKRGKSSEGEAEGGVPAVRFKDVRWFPLGVDIVMAARPLV